MVKWKEGTKKTPLFTAYVFEVWVDNVLWYWTTVKKDGERFFELMTGIFR